MLFSRFSGVTPLTYQKIRASARPINAHEGGWPRSGFRHLAFKPRPPLHSSGQPCVWAALYLGEPPWWHVEQIS